MSFYRFTDTSVPSFLTLDVQGLASGRAMVVFFPGRRKSTEGPVVHFLGGQTIYEVVVATVVPQVPIISVISFVP